MDFGFQGGGVVLVPWPMTMGPWARWPVRQQPSLMMTPRQALELQRWLWKRGNLRWTVTVSFFEVSRGWLYTYKYEGLYMNNIEWRGGGFLRSFYFHPDTWGNDRIWRANFSNGLTAPTRSSFFFPGFQIDVETCFFAKVFVQGCKCCWTVCWHVSNFYFPGSLGVRPLKL